MKQNYNLTRRTCYFMYIASSAVFSLPAMLFTTFNKMYGISFTLLGTLVFLNFSTQLIIDLIFTFFSHKFNIKLTVRFMPLLTALGWLIYVIIPTIFPQKAFLGLAIGTFVFSISCGLSEVLLSPLIVAMPSSNASKDMSKLHSMYAYGLVGVILLSTAYIKLFGCENWQYLALFFGFLPLIACLLFCLSPIPEININNDAKSNDKNHYKLGIALCFICIFLGSASEGVMTNWISSFIEKSLNISKTTGDIIGMASFALVFGITRTLYSKYGKNIYVFMMISMCGATVCYLTAGLCKVNIIALLACILTGFFTAMLWPGSLIFMEEKFPALGVTAYALMAAGGDLGGSIGPQITGIFTDKINIKTGMLFSSIYPVLGILVLIFIKVYCNKYLNKKTLL